MKVKIKNGELPLLLEGMRGLVGIKTVKKALDFGRDIKTVKNLIDEHNEAVEKIKIPRLVELHKEFEEKFSKELQEKGGISNVELETKWKNGKEFIVLMGNFNKKRSEFFNQSIEITFKTVFDDSDLSSVPDAKTAEMLIYFIK